MTQKQKQAIYRAFNVLFDHAIIALPKYEQFYLDETAKVKDALFPPPKPRKSKRRSAATRK